MKIRGTIGFTGIISYKIDKSNSNCNFLLKIIATNDRKYWVHSIAFPSRINIKIFKPKIIKCMEKVVGCIFFCD